MMAENRSEASQLESAQSDLGRETEGKRFGRRAAAYVIDLIVLYIINQAFGYITGIFLGVAFLFMGVTPVFDQAQLELLDRLAGIPLLIIYFTIFETLYGATAGKFILGMKVVQQSGEPVGLGAAFLRGLLRIVDGLFFGLVAYGSMKEPLYQRLGDKAAKTIVVDSKDSIIRRHRPWWTFAIGVALYFISFLVIIFIELLIAIP